MERIGGEFFLPYSLKGVRMDKKELNKAFNKAEAIGRKIDEEVAEKNRPHWSKVASVQKYNKRLFSLLEKQEEVRQTENENPTFEASEKDLAKEVEFLMRNPSSFVIENNPLAKK